VGCRGDVHVLPEMLPEDGEHVSLAAHRRDMRVPASSGYDRESSRGFSGK
jgi:hypothetical protein